jgi:glutamate dehydrogenase
MGSLLYAFDIVEGAAAGDCSRELAAAVYFAIGDRLGLDWLRDRVLELPRADRWQALARSALRDDLYELHRDLTREVLQRCTGQSAESARTGVELWLADNGDAVARARSVLRDVRASETFDTTTLPVVVRELKNLASEAAALS